MLPHLGQQHFTAFHIGDKGRVTLAKADQYTALLRHHLDPEASLVSVTPARRAQWWQDLPGFDSRVRHHFQQGALLELDLVIAVDVLQAATAANLEGLAAWLDASWRRLDDFEGRRLVEITVGFLYLHQHALTFKRTENKHRLAVDMRDSTSLVGHGFDGDLDWLLALVALPAPPGIYPRHPARQPRIQASVA